MASENAHKAEVLGSYIPALFTKENKMVLNINKCCVMTITPRVKLDTTYCIKYKDDKHNTRKVGCVKDLGVLFDTQLNFTDHSQEKIKKADRIIGLL